MIHTDEAYHAIAKLEKWYRRAKHQIFEISGLQGTGVFEVVKDFIHKMEFDPREVAYLSYDQKQVLELASKRLHAYYVNGIIYDYTRIVNFDTLPVINPHSTKVDSKWVKKVRSKIDPRYRILIVFDSTLISMGTLEDLCSFGLPIILIRDPGLIPAPDTFTFLREPNVELTDLNPVLMRNPITYFANKAIRGERIDFGSFDSVSVIPRKQLNLYNLKSSEMVLTLSEEMATEMNGIFRSKVMKLKTLNTAVGERVIVMNDMYGHRIRDENEKKIKIYLRKGLVGYLSKCNKHALATRYVPIEIRTEFYHEPFTDLYIDRNYLNGTNLPSRQSIPEDVVLLKYAYALSAVMARVSHWDKVTLIADRLDDDLYPRLLYNAITRCHQSLTLVI